MWPRLWLKLLGIVTWQENSMADYWSLGKTREVRINIENSIFLVNGREVKSREDALEYLKEIRGRYRDATHHTFCLIINGIFTHEDDGEPRGTAGLPIANILRKHHLNQVMVVVTRFFGGKKLGTRGLIEAYGKATQVFVEEALLLERKEGLLYTLSCSYALADQLGNLKIHPEIKVQSHKFTEKVELEIFIPFALTSHYNRVFEENNVEILKRNAVFL